MPLAFENRWKEAGIARQAENNIGEQH